MSAITSPSKKHYAKDVLQSPSKGQKTTDTQSKVAATFKKINNENLPPNNSSSSKKHPAEDVFQSPSKRQKITDTRLKPPAKFADIPDEILQSICLYLKWPEDIKNATQVCKDLNGAVKFWQGDWGNKLSEKIKAEKIPLTKQLNETVKFIAFQVLFNISYRTFPDRFMYLKSPSLPVIVQKKYGLIILETPVPIPNDVYGKLVAKAMFFDNEKVNECLAYRYENINFQKNEELYLMFSVIKILAYQPSKIRKYFPAFFGAVGSNSMESETVTLFQGRCGETLFEHLSRKEKMFTREWVLKVAMHIINGLAFLHKNGWIHRNLNLKNILIDYSNGAAQITGFESICVSERIINNGKFRGKINCVSDGNFLPIEFLEAREEVETEEDFAEALKLLWDEDNDIWQLGIILGYLFFGKFWGIAVGNAEEEDYPKIIAKWKEWRASTLSRESDPLIQLILSMLSEKEDRPNIKMVSTKLVEIAAKKYGLKLEPL